MENTLFYYWSHPKAKLFHPGSGTEICREWFAGTPSAGPCSSSDKFVKNIDLTTGTITCGTIPTCGAGEYLKFNGSSFSCTALATDTTTITTIINNSKTVVASSLATVQTFSASGGGGKDATVYCPAGWYRLSCGGSREPNLADNCEEEKCGFVGVMPIGANGCKVGIDSDPGHTNPTVYVTCMYIP